MKIRVKLFATLRRGRFDDRVVDLPRGATVAEVIASLNIPDKEVKIIFVNSRHAVRDRKLEDGDTLALFPPIGGG
jgi:molybdopterin converting factor small subunit